MNIEAGYVAYNGYVFTATDAALYNRTCADTNRILALAGDKPSPMCQASIERARDAQNRVFKIIIGVLPL